MKAVLLLQFTKMKREPVLFFSFIGLTILLVSVLGGFGSDQKQIVYTYSNATLETSELTDWFNTLNDSETLEFQEVTEAEARELVQSGDTNYALELGDSNYTFLVGTEDADQIAVEQYINQVYTEELRLDQVFNQSDDGAFRSKVEEELETPVMEVETEALQSSEQGSREANRFQVLIGMTLYFVIYTILFSLMTIISEKRKGTWDRLILSPLRKWQMYMGNLLYCFTIGFLQIGIVFLFFHFVLGYDFGPNIGTIVIILASYVFSIVAIGMLVMGILQSEQQLQAVNPIIATAMAMIGGAFWPIEAVSNQIMVAMSKGMPIYYGIEALKGTVLYNEGIGELLQPISILLLIGVVCMGIGINLMERVSR